jgi:NADH:ubiquinone oxidoreductase subunit K
MLNILLNTFLSNKNNINLHSKELNVLLLHLAMISLYFIIINKTLINILTSIEIVTRLKGINVLTFRSHVSFLLLIYKLNI